MVQTDNYEKLGKLFGKIQQKENHFSHQALV